MDDFMLIAPSGWSQLDYNFVMDNTTLNNQAIKDYIISNTFFEMQDALAEAGLVPNGATLNSAMIINDEYLFVQWG